MHQDTYSSSMRIPIPVLLGYLMFKIDWENSIALLPCHPFIGSAERIAGATLHREVCECCNYLKH
jgi:hypothetical protein